MVLFKFKFFGDCNYGCHKFFVYYRFRKCTVFERAYSNKH